MEMSTSTEFKQRRIEPKKFGLWISLASLIMMFGALTSAYIVRQSAGNWLEFQVPTLFLWSTVIIVLSSVFLQYAYESYKKGNETGYKLGLISAFLLGIGFLIMQYYGWKTLYSMGVDFNINPSASFFYIINWLHAAHILAGLTTLVVALLHAYLLDFAVTEKRKNRFQLVVHFWHFLGVLWIYLYIFLLLTR